ncbi:Rv3235 family protein [Paeniglutamicibacter cryotolerans]|uniref:Uncharacterized protein n=1 Tax=Paeniglutamicibacter cryotolerans TaxID=670079 RepID=A0A839QLD3_9MICC|nr:Rv3235 family protein [Paeniglutamicibacter cryotolerans]MBB2996610.1 hypothetical protein [Paeniglutamicibacter cryotolerans]
MTLLAAPEPLVLHLANTAAFGATPAHAPRARRFPPQAPRLDPQRHEPGGPAVRNPAVPAERPGEDIEDIGESLAALGAAPDTGAPFLSTHTKADHEVALLARALAAATFESLIGQRPVQQLARWYSADCLAKLSRRRELLRASCPDPGARSFHCPCVRQVRVSRLSDTIYEAAVVVDEKTSVRAAALRLERWRGRWLATALEIG